MIKPSRLVMFLGLAIPMCVLHSPVLAQSSCSAKSGNGDKRCSITCPAGQTASCSDSAGSIPPDCHCSGTQSATVPAKLGKPDALSPSGPSPRSPQFLWTEVPGAKRYKITLHTPTYTCPPPPPPQLGVTRSAGTDGVYADPTIVCSHGKCGFRVNWDIHPFQGYPHGVSLDGLRGLTEIYCSKEANNNTVTFTWSVHAVAGPSDGPESNELSYTLAEVPPKPPPPPPLQSNYVVTCVFKTGPNFWAWYNGVFAPFVNSWGQVTPGVLDQTFTFSKPTFQNCNGLVNGAIPVDSAKFAVKMVSVCTNLVNGSQETFINLACPTKKDSRTRYEPYTSK